MKATQRKQILVNNLEGVQAAAATSASAFSEEIGIREKRFIKLNDLPETEQIEAGAYYYTQRKRPNGEVATHVVEAGETLWSISQKYGIRLASLKSKNRIRKNSELRPGMVLNLKESLKRGAEIPTFSEPKPVVTSPTPPAAQPKVEQAPPQKVQQPQTPSYSFHTVSAGETLFSISKRYGMSVEDLKQLNSIGAQNLITIGQKLRILIP